MDAELFLSILAEYLYNHNCFNPETSNLSELKPHEADEPMPWLCTFERASIPPDPDPNSDPGLSP